MLYPAKPDPLPQSRITVSLPATCGELAQGLWDGEPCLVSCPVGWFNEVTVAPARGVPWRVPPGFVKVTRAVAVLTSALHLGPSERGGEIAVRSPFPRGRGYGSSTADVGAALYAAASAVGYPLSPEDVAQLAVRVEPTDSTVFPGLALFAHRTASHWEPLGPAPPLQVILLDPGGVVDTETYNRMVSPAQLRPLARAHREAFDLLRWGLAHQVWEAVGEAATLSARTHQHVLPNPLLECVLAWLPTLRRWGALGICRAHSGTLVGIVCGPQAALEPLVAFVRQRVGKSVTVRVLPLVDGGPRWLIGAQQQANGVQEGGQPPCQSELAPSTS